MTEELVSTLNFKLKEFLHGPNEKMADFFLFLRDNKSLSWWDGQFLEMLDNLLKVRSFLRLEFRTEKHCREILDWTFYDFNLQILHQFVVKQQPSIKFVANIHMYFDVVAGANILALYWGCNQHSDLLADVR